MMEVRYICEQCTHEGTQRVEDDEVNRLKAELDAPRMKCPDCAEIRGAWQQDIAERDSKIDRLKADLEDLLGPNYEPLRQENEKLKAALKTFGDAVQKQAGYSAKRCVCVFGGVGDDPLTECDYHRAMRAELADLRAVVKFADLEKFYERIADYQKKWPQ